MRVAQKDYINNLIYKYQDRIENVKDNFSPYKKVSADEIIEINKALFKEDGFDESQISDFDIFAMSGTKLMNKLNVNDALLRFDAYKYSTKSDMIFANAAYIMCSLMNPPLFEENNMQTALYAGLLLLEKNGISIDISKETMELFCDYIIEKSMGKEGQEFETVCDSASRTLRSFYNNSHSKDADPTKNFLEYSDNITIDLSDDITK